MTTIRLTLDPCACCGRDAAAIFERSIYAETVFFAMCDPARRGCGACTEGETTAAGAVALWATTDADQLGRQRRVAA